MNQPPLWCLITLGFAAVVSAWLFIEVAERRGKERYERKLAGATEAVGLLDRIVKYDEATEFVTREALMRRLAEELAKAAVS